MNEKNLRILINMAGIGCFLVFIAVRVPPLFNLMVKEKVIPGYWENTTYGELYNFNSIKYFKEDLPPSSMKYRFKPGHPTVQDADILTFGDSFFDFTRLTTFPERLGDTLRERVFYERYDYPLQYLAEKKYEGYQPKILIYETAERYVSTRFTYPHSLEFKVEDNSRIREILAGTRDLVFQSDAETRYSLLLSRSYLTKDIYSFIATLKFDAFGYISDITPVYSSDLKKPWLFYYEETTSDSTGFYYPVTDQEINNYCDNIADLMIKLKQAYNLKMIFMPVPSKYTIYHKFVNNDAYNNFLPRLYDGLKSRQVPYVDLYNDYMSSADTLYFGTDTHWNKKGLDIALNKTIDLIRDVDTGYLAHDSIKPENH